MGLQLGMKIGRAFSSLGNKVARGVRKIGEKDMAQINKVNKLIGDPMGQVNSLAKDVVLKSGAITNGLRIGTDIGDKVFGAAVGLGAGNIPVYGKYVLAGQKGMSALKDGAAYIDQKRDQEEARLSRNAARDTASNGFRYTWRDLADKLDKKVMDDMKAARERLGNIEKMNGRKQEIIAQESTAPPNVFF